MEIQRYDMIRVTRCIQAGELECEPEGEWVRHEDHLAALAAQQEEIDRLKAQWEEHTKHVGRFLTEMYQTMIDPLDEPEPSLKIAELCEMLLNQAREDREKLNRSPFNWPADWNKDSSLETWFPLTAEELTRIKAENAKLQARLDAMSAPVSDEELKEARATIEQLKSYQANYEHATEIERAEKDADTQKLESLLSNSNAERRELRTLRAMLAARAKTEATG